MCVIFKCYTLGFLGFPAALFFSLGLFVMTDQCECEFLQQWLFDGAQNNSNIV